MTTETERDRYTMNSLETWLEQVNGDSLREQVREAMLAVLDTDPDYYGSQSWELIHDRAKCNRLEEAYRER